MSDTTGAAELIEQVAKIQGLTELAAHVGVTSSDSAPLTAAAIDFVLEGLYADKKISRTDEWQYRATDQPRSPARVREPFLDPGIPIQRPGKKKNYYN